MWLDIQTLAEYCFYQELHNINNLEKSIPKKLITFLCGPSLYLACKNDKVPILTYLAELTL